VARSGATSNNYGWVCNGIEQMLAFDGREDVLDNEIAILDWLSHCNHLSIVAQFRLRIKFHPGAEPTNRQLVQLIAVIVRFYSARLADF